MTATRVRTLVILLLAALVATGIVQASAAQLNVRSTTLLSVKKAPCTTATIGVTHGAISTTDQQTSSVVVTVPAACAGLPIALRLYKTGGTALHAADLTVASASSPTTTITLATADRYTPSEVLGVALTIGTWGMRTAWTYTPPAGPVNTCQVRNSDGSVDPSKPCTVTGATTWDYWGSAGSGQGWFKSLVSAPGIANDQYIAFTVTIVGAPTWWTWSTAGTKGSGTQVSSSCSALPVMSGRLATNVGPSPQVYVELVDKRAGASGITCVGP